MTNPTFELNGQSYEIPRWLIQAAVADPTATARILERMRGRWPDDFIEALESHPFLISVSLPLATDRETVCKE